MKTEKDKINKDVFPYSTNMNDVKQLEKINKFQEYIDNLINQIDKRPNSFNVDDMRFIAVKGYEYGKK